MSVLFIILMTMGWVQPVHAVEVIPGPNVSMREFVPASGQTPRTLCEKVFHDLDCEKLKKPPYDQDDHDNLIDCGHPDKYDEPSLKLLSCGKGAGEAALDIFLSPFYMVGFVVDQGTYLDRQCDKDPDVKGILVSGLAHCNPALAEIAPAWRCQQILDQLDSQSRMATERLSSAKRFEAQIHLQRAPPAELAEMDARAKCLEEAHKGAQAEVQSFSEREHGDGSTSALKGAVGAAQHLYEKYGEKLQCFTPGYRAELRCQAIVNMATAAYGVVAAAKTGLRALRIGREIARRQKLLAAGEDVESLWRSKLQPAEKAKLAEQVAEQRAASQRVGQGYEALKKTFSSLIASGNKVAASDLDQYMIAVDRATIQLKEGETLGYKSLTNLLANVGASTEISQGEAIRKLKVMTRTLERVSAQAGESWQAKTESFLQSARRSDLITDPEMREWSTCLAPKLTTVGGDLPQINVCAESLSAAKAGNAL